MARAGSNDVNQWKALNHRHCGARHCCPADWLTRIFSTCHYWKTNILPSNYTGRAVHPMRCFFSSFLGVRLRHLRPSSKIVIRHALPRSPLSATMAASANNRRHNRSRINHTHRAVAKCDKSCWKWDPNFSLIEWCFCVVHFIVEESVDFPFIIVLFDADWYWRIIPKCWWKVCVIFCHCFGPGNLYWRAILRIHLVPDDLSICSLIVLELF
jgi:hypothetical protein